MSQPKQATVTKKVSKGPTFLRLASYAASWALIPILLFIGFRPFLISFLEPSVVVIFCISIPLLSLIAGWNFLGALELLKWFFGFWWFPFRVAWRFFAIALGGVVATYMWHKKFSSKILLLAGTVVVALLGLFTEEPTLLKVLGSLSALGLIIVILRISEKAFDPLGSVGKVIDSIIGLKDNPFFKMALSFFTRKDKTADGGKDTEKSVERLIGVLGFAFKAPQWIENPKLPLGLFIINLVPIVALTILLFGVMYKAILIGTPFASTLSNSDYFLMSLYQFTGSNFHSFSEMPKSLAWPFGIEALVRFYYEVILVLAFGLTAQTQSSVLAKKFSNYLTKKLNETVKDLPRHLGASYSKEERELINQRIAENVELKAHGIEVKLYAATNSDESLEAVKANAAEITN